MLELGAISKRILKTRQQWCLLNLIVSLLLLLFIEVAGIDANNSLFLIYSIWLLLVYGILSLSELRYPGLNMMSILFVGSIMSMAYPSFSYALELLEGKKVYYDDNINISDFLFHTSVALNVFFSLFFLLLTIFTRKKLFIVDIREVARRFNLFWVCIFVYIIALILRFVPFLELISSILAMLANSLPMLVLLLLSLYCGFHPVHDKYYKLFVVLVAVEVLYSMFFGFYKGVIVRAAIMYLLYYYIHCRTLGKSLISGYSVLLAAGFIIFLLYIVYPFITLRRIETGFGANTLVTELPKVDNLDILRRVLTFDYPKNMLSDDGDNAALQDRLSSIAPSAFFYRNAYRNGYHTEMIEQSIQAMVPRFISPNKRDGSPGAMAVSYVRDGSFDPEYNSAESVGLFASAYFWGGWPAALLMCFISAVVVSLLLRACFSNLQNLFSWLIIFYLIFNMLTCFKETADGGYSMSIMYIIYAIIIYVTSFIFKTRKKTTQVNTNNQI